MMLAKIFLSIHEFMLFAWYLLGNKYESLFQLIGYCASQFLSKIIAVF